MEVLHIDIVRLRGLLWNRQSKVAKKAGLEPGTVSRRLIRGDLTIGDINALAHAGGFSVRECVKFTRIENEGEEASEEKPRIIRGDEGQGGN